MLVAVFSMVALFYYALVYLAILRFPRAILTDPKYACEPFNFTPKGGSTRFRLAPRTHAPWGLHGARGEPNEIDLAPRTRAPWGLHRACVEPNEIKKIPARHQKCPPEICYRPFSVGRHDVYTLVFADYPIRFFSIFLQYVSWAVQNSSDRKTSF